MNDNPARFLDLGSRAWKQSEVNKKHSRLNEWATAFAASKIVGRYDGGTAKFSASCGISDDTTERLAAAWIIYTRLAHTDALRARKNRKSHGYMRFLTLGSLWRRYENFDDQQAFEYLESGLSNAAMEQQIIDIHDPLPEWHRKGISLYAQLEKWTTDESLPLDIKQAAKNLQTRLVRLTV